MVVPLKKQRGGKFLIPWEDPDQMNLDEVTRLFIWGLKKKKNGICFAFHQSCCPFSIWMISDSTAPHLKNFANNVCLHTGARLISATRCNSLQITVTRLHTCQELLSHGVSVVYSSYREWIHALQGFVFFQLKRTRPRNSSQSRPKHLSMYARKHRREK